MATLSEEQIAEVEKLIESHGVLRRLSPGQKWDVTLIIGGVILAAVTLLGFGGAAIVERAAQLRSETVIVSQLKNDPDFTKNVATTAPSLPSGAVIAFAPTLSGISPACPDDWSFYSEASGRFLLAAGSGDGLSPRAVGDIGGVENVALTLDQMPSHSHDLYYVTISAQGLKYSDAATGANSPYFSSSSSLDLGITRNGTAITGGNQPHNNMPPYIALYYCKKD